MRGVMPRKENRMVFNTLKKLFRADNHRQPSVTKIDSNNIVEYIFVDEKRLRSYLEQIQGPQSYDKIPSWDINLSLTGLAVSGKQVSSPRPYTHNEMIDTLFSHLKQNDLLDYVRPKKPFNDCETGKIFGLEDMMARKAIFPIIDNKNLPGLRQLAVWVSEPSHDELNGSGYGEGTFLYLIEAYWESDEPYHSTISGCSALGWILNNLEAHSIIPKTSTSYGELRAKQLKERGLSPYLKPYKFEGKAEFENKDHPIKILEKLGAFIQPGRKIRSLYRKRYITDEMYFKNWRRRHRSNDLVAYPIFIAES
jgi:hypothetical protein